MPNGSKISMIPSACVVGICLRRNPMSSKRSASSNTSTRRCCRSSTTFPVFWRRWSCRQPGWHRRSLGFWCYQRLYVSAHGAAADQAHDAKCLPERRSCFRSNLQRELSRGRNDERADGAIVLSLLEQSPHGRQQERDGLAVARLGLDLVACCDVVSIVLSLVARGSCSLCPICDSVPKSVILCKSATLCTNGRHAQRIRTQISDPDSDLRIRVQIFGSRLRSRIRIQDSDLGSGLRSRIRVSLSRSGSRSLGSKFRDVSPNLIRSHFNPFWCLAP